MTTIKTTNTGKVKFFNSAKNFGFIIDDAELDANKNPKQYFFHSSGTLDCVVTDDLVEYNVEIGDRGPKAVQVKRVKSLQPPI